MSETESPKPFYEFALASDTETLDPDHPLNTTLRENGIAFVPNLAGVDLEERWATTACSAIMAFLTVPLGWHVFDDGRRTFICDSDNTRQINFNLSDSGGLSAEEIVESVIAQVTREYPEAQWQTADLDGMKTLIVLGVPIDEQLAAQVFMYKEASLVGNNLLLQIRVTSLPEEMQNLMDMLETIMSRFRFIQETPA